MIKKIIEMRTAEALRDAMELIKELEEEGSVIGHDGKFEKRYYDKAKQGEAYKLAKEVRIVAAQQLKKTGDSEYSEIYKEALRFSAREDFDCAFRYAEWNREPDKKFYEPRREQLLPVVRALERLERREIKRLLVEMPPGAGKTGTALGFLTWSGLRNPLRTILGVSNNNEFLRGAYDEVLRMLDPQGEYLWHEIFPASRVIETYAKGMRIDLNTRKRYQTYQFGSVETRMAGRYRANNLLYCDDLVGSLEQALSATQMEKLWGRYSTDARQRMIGDCAELVIQTPWSISDPIDRLALMYEEDAETELVRLPALDENDESNFDYPYGLGYTTSQLHEQRSIMDDASWRAIYMCEPVEREAQLFNSDELKRYFELPEAEPDVVMAVCDTKETGPDYCAMPIVYKYGDEYYIDYWLCDNGNPDVIEKRIAQIFVDRHVKIARFESNRGGTLFARNVQEIVKQKGGQTKITTKWNQTNKETRILTRAAWVKEHCIFKDVSLYDKEYRTAMEMLCKYSMSGRNKHDDVPDVLADLADYAENIGIATVSVGRRFF